MSAGEGRYQSYSKTQNKKEQRSTILVMLDLVRISAQIGENQLPCADSLAEIFLQYCLGEGSKKYSTLANRQTLAIERCPPITLLLQLTGVGRKSGYTRRPLQSKTLRITFLS